MDKRPKIVLIYGGKSVEHQISCRSAAFVFNNVDRKKFQVHPVGVHVSGKWIPQHFSPEDELKKWEVLPILSKRDQTHLEIPPIGLSPQEMLLAMCGLSKSDSSVVFFPLIHGTFGEDGTLQGLFELAEIPYVGSNTLSSSVCMDKIIAKRLVEAGGVPIVPYMDFDADAWNSRSEEILKKVEGLLFPLIVKPASLGSSVGVSKVNTLEELRSACTLAFRYDEKVLVEKFLQPLREIECAIIGSGILECAPPGEVIPHGDLYSYKAKYIEKKGASLKIPAILPEKKVGEAQNLAIQIAETLSIAGMARIDLFLVEDRFYFNEANSIPGFTEISQYPLLWKNAGLSESELIERLVELALKRFQKSLNLEKLYSGNES